MALRKIMRLFLGPLEASAGKVQRLIFKSGCMYVCVRQRERQW
jgi:hypothetical protein